MKEQTANSSTQKLKSIKKELDFSKGSLRQIR